MIAGQNDLWTRIFCARRRKRTGERPTHGHAMYTGNQTCDHGGVTIINCLVVKHVNIQIDLKTA